MSLSMSMFLTPFYYLCNHNNYVDIGWSWFQFIHFLAYKLSLAGWAETRNLTLTSHGLLDIWVFTMPMRKYIRAFHFNGLPQECFSYYIIIRLTLKLYHRSTVTQYVSIPQKTYRRFYIKQRSNIAIGINININVVKHSFS